MVSQANILVDNSGKARIMDFGLAMVTKNLDSIPSTSHHGHTPRWSAPEVLSEGAYSKEADVFSFAMVMIEVCPRFYFLPPDIILPLFRINAGVYRSYSF